MPENQTPNAVPPQTKEPRDKRKFYISLGIAGAVILLALFLLSRPGDYQFPGNYEPQSSLPASGEISGPQTETEAPPPEATGEIDDVEAALIQDSLGEFDLVEEFDESDLLTSDDGILNSYANIYDENEL